MRKKQRAGSPSASDAGGEHYERGVDADRNNRDLRQDEEDERKAEEPDENDEALGMSVVVIPSGTGLISFSSVEMFSTKAGLGCANRSDW